MTLVQTFTNPISGYFDNGPKQHFEWNIEPLHCGQDSKGKFVRIGSWEANHWFNITLGKTDKITLSNARQKLAASAKRANQKCTFEYKEN